MELLHILLQHHCPHFMLEKLSLRKNVWRILRVAISKNRKRIVLLVLNYFHGIFLMSTVSLLYTKEGFKDTQNRKLYKICNPLML